MRGTVAASLIVVVATAAGSVANFLFQWLAARRLDAGDFSLLAAMLAIVTVALLPGAPLGIAIVRRLVAERSARAGLPEGTIPPVVGLARARRTGIGAGLALLAAIGAVSAFGGDRLHVGGEGAALLWFAAVAATVSWLAIVPELSRVQAAGRFASYGRAQMLLAASRLLFGGGALLLGAGPGVALLCLAPGPWLVRATLPRAGAAEELRVPWLRELAGPFAATGGLQALIVLDVVFARAHFAAEDPAAAGSYAICSTLARALFHLPFAITAVTVQRTSAAAAAGLPLRGILLSNLGLSALLVGGGVLLLGGFPGMVIEVFAGRSASASEVDLLRRLLLPMALASLAAVPAHYLLALGRRSPLWILGSAPLALAVLLARPVAAPEELVPPLILVEGATLAALLIAALLVPTISSPGGTDRGNDPRSA